MVARLYSLNFDGIKNLKDGKTKSYLSNMKGQARIVFDDMRDNPTARLATDITKSCGSKIQTRQDVFRVVLYYILVFKSKGLVKATEPENIENENAFAGIIPADENIEN